MNDQDLTRRAFRAYFRSAHPYQPDIPSSYSSGPERANNGLPYIVLRGGRNDSGVCAVYRVRNDLRLRRLTRWPAEFAA